MASPCNNLNVVPIKVSQLVRYQNLDLDDIILTIESGSKLISRRSTIGDLKRSFSQLTGSYTGSFSGSFKGKSSGSFSGSYWGKIISKNTIASGSFSGSHYGKLVSKNATISGSFSGSYWGKVISKNTVASGSFSGSHYGKFVGKNASVSGSFSGSYWGKVISKNVKATGSFSGSTWGSIISKNSKLSGSFSGSIWGNMISKNAKLTGSFSGSLYSKKSLLTGSFKGIDNITNFKGTGKKVSFNGTASYAVSASYVSDTSFIKKYQSTYDTIPSYGTGVKTFNFSSVFTGAPDQFFGYIQAISTDNGYTSGSRIPLEFFTTDPASDNVEFNPVALIYDNNTGYLKFIRSSAFYLYAFSNSGTPGVATYIDETKWRLRVVAIKYNL